ncbi:MAG: prephenate dehydrogenase [Bdellovibrionales bacterium]|nr:prephenate dehydrogenase [Oligoflexia bacterium]
MKLGVIGLGLIGGSLALELKASGNYSEVIGVDESAENCKDALALGLIDRIVSFDEACAGADLMVIATPVSSIKTLLSKILDRLPVNSVVTDVGSTKSSIVEEVRLHSKRKQYVASHPMAGTEFSGPKAAHLGLFAGKAAVICDRESSLESAVQKVESAYLALKMRLIFMESRAHDLHAAYVSHLSHISSFILANTVLDKEKDVDAIFNLASGGFESTVRLAKSSPETWNPIFEQNREFVSEALGAYIERLKLFHESLLKEDFTTTQNYMKQANQIGRVLAEIGKRGT